jgi:hypothetical protein
MEIVPPIAEKWTFCILFAFQKAGSVPDFVFLRNAALTGKHRGPSAILWKLTPGNCVPAARLDLGVMKI